MYQDFFNSPLGDRMRHQLSGMLDELPVVAKNYKEPLPHGLLKVSCPPLTEIKNKGEILKVGSEYYLLHEDAYAGETEITGEFIDQNEVIQ